ncbi:MAG: phosphoglucosamine mutase [Ruminococcaceae bacterium]|nr:phosphoglucosamine mutase [Oscillospiraceae bacterium]MBR3595963.1 phosphoglucosamine mutase [Clostridia bacterium]
MGRLFGTDGVRGIANTEISCELATKMGRAVATVLRENTGNKKLRILIGTDTRISADMLSCALSAGFCSAGCDVLLLGVVPTPAVAFLVKKYGYDAGVMISASHNTFEYNGIKIFLSDGYKLPDETEDKVEAIILDGMTTPVIKTGSEIGTVNYGGNAVDDYIRHIEKTAVSRFYGMKIAVDCANGSASVTAKELFGRLGAECTVINSAPDGINVNDACGSTHIENIQEFVRKNGFDIGFSFDGDADRLLCVDSDGTLVDGDKIIAVCAKDMKKRKKLSSDTAVVTVMSNMGLIRFFEKNGIKYELTKVGDRYVLEKMLEKGYNIGGEQSGHIIFSEYAATGDGQLTAVMLLNVIKTAGRTIKELADEIEIYPQVLKNVRVSSLGKLRLSEDEEIKIAIKQAEQELSSEGRVLVRASGTEPLVRIMLEGKDSSKIERLSELIAQVIRERLI